MRPLPEQTILITGATDGLGRALARELAGGGARILLHGRDDAKGERTIAEIAEETGNEELLWLRADLASLDQVRGLGELVLGETGRLDVLVNNAGIGTTTAGVDEREESREGFELRFAVNYLAGYLLTRLLLGLLEGSAPARIINVSSAGQAPIDFDDVMLTRRYSGVQAYCQSKVAQIMFTFDLAEELRERGVTATCLHPATYMPTQMVLGGWNYWLLTASPSGNRTQVRSAETSERRPATSMSWAAEERPTSFAGPRCSMKPPGPAKLLPGMSVVAA